MLEGLFSPKSIAVIGASHTPGKLGYDVLNNIQSHGFTGKIYPINPTTDTILGLQAYPSVTVVSGKIDVAVITVPADVVPTVLRECGKKKIPFAVVISAGFKEVGPEGKQKEEELVAIAKRYNIRLIGPNCLGYISAPSHLNASFASGMPQQGNIALISQSGAVGVAMLDWAYQSHLGFSHIISIGNKADITELECLEYCITDPRTKVIMLYLESIDYGVAFMRLAARVAKKKPIIVLKAGASIQAKQAVNSHTGSLAGSEEAINAGFARAGVIRARTVQEFFDCGLAFSFQPLPKSNRIAIITNAGGPGIMAVDEAERVGVKLPQISQSLQKRLRTGLPASANVKNPIDVIGDATADRYQHALTTVLSSTEVDGVVVVLTPQVMTDSPAIAQVIIRAQKKFRKPVVASFMGGVSVRESRIILHDSHIPNYETPERAIAAMGQLIAQKQRSVQPLRLSRLRAKTLPNTDGHIQIRTQEAEQLAANAGLPVLRSVLIKTPQECESIQVFPVVMKIASRDVVHKAATGAVMLNIRSVAEARRAFATLTKSVHKALPNAEIEGVLVQAQLPKTDSCEVIIGMKRDASFGPVVLFGYGGGLVEFFHDVAFAIAPVTVQEARAMIASIHTAPLLDGFDTEAIAKAIVQVSTLSLQYPHVTSLDMNPMMVFQKGKGATIVDIRMLV